MEILVQIIQDMSNEIIVLQKKSREDILRKKTFEHFHKETIVAKLLEMYTGNNIVGLEDVVM
jgi:hypothetical protein